MDSYKSTSQSKLEAIARGWDGGRGWNGNTLVLLDGSVLLKQSRGFASEELGVPISAATKFKVFSLSKQFTAVAAMKLVERGQLDLDAPVTKYLGKLPSSWATVTMRMLLQHTAGVPQSFETTWIDTWEQLDARTNLQTFEAVRLKLPATDFVPGSNWAYSNMGYIIAGCVIEKIAGMPFEQFVTENVFRPLNMLSTSYDHQAAIKHDVYSGEAVIKGLASGYNGTPETQEMATSKEWLETPAGGVITTINDLETYARAYLQGTVLDAKLASAMIDHPYVVNDHFSYGLGWSMRTIGGSPANYHSGGTNGFSCDLVLIPSQKLVVIVMSNRGFDNAEAFAKALIEAALSHGTERTGSRQ